MNLQKAFPKQREHYFWAVISCLLLYVCLPSQCNLIKEKGIRTRISGLVDQSIDKSRTPFQRQATSENSLAHLPTGW